MYSRIIGASLYGIDAMLVTVETDISDGMPIFEMVGLLSGEVKEAKERVRTALKNIGYSLPIKRITVNFSPANIKKSGSGYDLPVAIALLCAMGVICNDNMEDFVIIGELALDGSIRGVNGILPTVLKAYSEGKKYVLVPYENILEAKIISDVNVIGIKHLNEAIDFFNEGIYEEDLPVLEDYKEEFCENDFSAINGQATLKRACEIAVSGMHNLLMIGPPGAGKTLAAKCIPSILPEMTLEEQMEVSKIYSVCGMLNNETRLLNVRPFRAPHHTISDQGLAGGGRDPKPGEISLAHKGVLFLDELTEFRKSTLEILRQPLEDKRVRIARAAGNFDFPADFVLVGAMNPCNCGYYPNLNKCRCSQASLKRYFEKLSQPLLDRIDICVMTETVGFKDISAKTVSEDSATIKMRVSKVQEIQKKRYSKEKFLFNSQIPSDLIGKYCSLSLEDEQYMEKMYEKFSLTARTYHKVLRVARTIADMDGEDNISRRHLIEALAFRGMDDSFWRVI